MAAALSSRHEAFARLVADPTCPTLADAYVRAGFSKRASPTTLSRNARALAAKPEIAARVAELREAASREVTMSVADAMKAWVDLWLADPADLVRPVRQACRHCYGIKHAYQWIDEGEHAIAVAQAIEARSKSKRPDEAPDLPTCEGGFGYSRDRPPVPTCYRCEGEGIATVWFADPRTVTGRSRLLYAGAKMGRNGIEILLHDRAEALRNLSRALGLFADKRNEAPLGGDGAPASDDATLPETIDPIEASRRYKAAVGR